MSAIISRQLIQRPSRQLTSVVRSHVSVRGQATTTKAKEAVQNVTSKASQGLTKVSSSVSESTSSAASSAADAAKSSGGRIGRMVQTVQAYIPVITHQSRVALEVGKIVAKGQGMGIPSMAQMTKTYDPLITAVRNPYNAGHHAQGLVNAIPGYLNSMRNMNSAQAISAAVVVAEVIGFFTVGEMLGKMKIVGYRGPGSQQQHPVTEH